MTGALLDEEAHAAAGVRRVGMNALSLLGAYVLPRVFTVGAVVVAARVLGAERFGAYGAAAAFAVILSVLATLGMHPLLVRDLARDPAAAPRLLRAAHLVKTVANVVMFAMVYGLARPGAGLEGEARAAALLLGAAYAIGAYGENLSAYFQAVERMHVWTEASALFGVVTGVLGVLAVWMTASVAWFCAAPLAGQTVALVWLLMRAPPAVRQGARAQMADVMGLARSLVPFVAAFVALTLHYKLDVLLMQRWRSAADVGLYTAAYKFVDVFQALVIVGASALYPRLSRAAQHVARSSERTGEPGPRWAGTRATEFALLAAVPMGGALHLASGGAVATLFGASYAGASPAVGWLALALPALALNLLGGYLLGAAHRMGWVATLYASSLALKIGLNAVLIPAWGPVGAGAAMAITETALAGAILLVLRRNAQVVPGARAMGTAFGAAALLPLARLVDDPTGGLVVGAGYLVAVAALYALTGVVHPRVRRVIGRALREREVVTQAP